MYDVSSTESYDTVGLGYQNWWNCTTQAGIYTLEDFISYMDSVHPELRSEIGTIMACHKISPDAPIPSTYSASEPPELTFVVNGSEAHPNNRFVVYFYDATGNYLGETDMFNQHGQYLDEDNIDDSFVGHRETVTVQIDNDVWQSVLQEIEADCATGATVYVSIGGYRYDDTSSLISDDIREYSGPYFSPYAKLENVYLPHNYTFESVNENRHRQVCTDCGSVLNTASHHLEYVSVNDQYHKQVCEDCGYSTGNQLHTLKSSELGNRYKYCTACGHTVITGGNLILPVGPNGIIEEEYTE